MEYGNKPRKVLVDFKKYRQLKQREKECPTMLESEARALLRSLQEIRGILDLPDTVSPHEIVNNVRRLKTTLEIINHNVHIDTIEWYSYRRMLRKYKSQ